MARAQGGRQVASLQRRVNQACSSTRTAARREAPARESTMMIGGRVVTGVHSEGKRNRGIFSGLFGNSRSRDEVTVARDEPSSRVERVNLDEARPSRSSSGGGSAATATRSSGRAKGELRVGNYRTVCVRLCDGFYFPINSRSHSDNFYDELAMCVGRCPGADVSLYAHGNGSPVESMRSTMTGERYVNLPTAFAYRKRPVAECGCQPMSTGAPDEKRVETVVASLKSDDEVDTVSDAPDEPEISWTPFKAVYDETGKPLPPLKTDRSSEAPERPTGLTLPDRPRRSGAATTLAMDVEREYRAVGPQFYSENGSSVALAKPKTTGGIATTAVTVIPLGTTAPRNTAGTRPLARVSMDPAGPGPGTVAPASAAPATSAPVAPPTPGDSTGLPDAVQAPADPQQEARGPLEVRRGG